MTDRDNQKPSVGEGFEPRPLPPAPRSPRLDTGDRVRCELARIYRLARAGQIPWEAATKAAHILYSLHRMLDAATLDTLVERISRLEAAKAAQR